jgi:8-oxo-dGTP diphosphatase
VNEHEKYPTPYNTVDLVLMSLMKQKLHVYLVRRPTHKNEPCAGLRALPGGFVHVQEDKDLEDAARRILAQKAGVMSSLYVEQLQTFSGPKRDPRGWSVSQSYCALVPEEVAMRATMGEWVEVEEAIQEKLAFDHAAIIACALLRVRNKTNYSILPAHLLGEEFTFHELKSAYEHVLQVSLDKSTFRSRINGLDALEAIVGKMKSGHQRPAQMYRLKNNKSVFLKSNLI